MLMTGFFMAGAGAGALLSYARDRNLLRLYGHLVEDLSGMIPHRPDSPEPPAVAARVADMPSTADALRKCAS